MSEPYRSTGIMHEQMTQYPDLQAVGMNGLQAGAVIENANRINNAQDIMARHPGADPTILEHEINDAYKHIDRYLGNAAARNVALRPSDPKPQQPSASSSRRPRRVVNEDGRIVPYGQMTRAVGGSRHPQTGRIVSY